MIVVMRMIRVYNSIMVFRNSNTSFVKVPSDPALGQAGSGAAVVPPASRQISSQALFDGLSEVQIEHNGLLYRLRQTALGKLILTK